MDAQMSIESSFDSLNDLMRRVNTNPLLKKYIGEFLCKEISNLTRDVQYQLQRRVSDIFSSGLENVTDDFLLQLFDQLCSSEKEKEELERILLKQVYYWDYKSRFPKTYTNHFEPAILMNLTSQENLNSNNRPFTFLNLYDHKYYLDRNPMIVRTVTPQYEPLRKRRAKHSSIPIEDMAFFVYNSEEIRTGQSRSAIVSLDGESFSRLDLDHNRVKIVERDSTRREALCSGIYPGRNYILPLVGLRRFWQQGFVKFLAFKENFFFLSKSDSLTITEQQYQVLQVQSAKFLGDKLSPKQYWSSLLSLPVLGSFLESSLFSQEVLSIVNTYKSNPDQENLKEYYFAFKAMTII